MHRTKKITILALVAAALAWGCNFGDESSVDIQDDLTFQLFGSKLHTPYVVGAQVNISVYSNEDENEASWSAEVTSPSVFRIDERTHNGSGLELRCTALAAGEATLRITDANGRTKATRTIRVEQPDRIVLAPAGHIKVHGDKADGLDLRHSVNILAGGTATFEVLYYRGSERLFGNGALGVMPADYTLQALPRTSYVFENREWLSLTPTVAGLTSVDLAVGGEVLATVSVVGVEEEAIDFVRIEAEPTSGAEEGDLFHILARAYDQHDNEIFGVTFDWTVDGLDQPGDGDLFTYEYSEETESEVAAHAGSESAAVSVYMSGGYVASSNAISCSTATPGASLPSILLPLLAFGLISLCRRRTRG